MRLFVFCSTILLFAVFQECCSYRYQTKKSVLVKVKRDVRVLEHSKLADGTKFERIEESGNELPPLPIEEEVDDLTRIGHLDEQGELLIPVDENGNVLKGFEYLLKPIVVQIDITEAEKGDGKIVHDAKILPEEETNSKILSGLTRHRGNPENKDGDYYEQEEEQENVPNIPKLPSVDYSDSGENDEDLKVEQMPDMDKNEESKEIEIPSNKASNEKEFYNAYENGNNNPVDNILRPDPAIVEIPIPKEQEEDQKLQKAEKEAEQINIPQDVELTDKDIEDLATSLGEAVFSKIMPKDGDDREGKGEGDLDGHILEVPELTEEEKQRIREESEKSPEVEIPSNRDRPIVRGGRLTPDNANSSNILLSIAVALLFSFLFR